MSFSLLAILINVGVNGRIPYMTIPTIAKATFVGISSYPKKVGARMLKIELTMGEDNTFDITPAYVKLSTNSKRLIIYV